jgi:isopentenyl diphosphate isomerase/L-lactate dehydrogenase-like FMN-dependent dehydrogenase
MANTSIQDVAQQGQHGSLLFQLYCIRDRDLVAQWVRQAEACGYKALVITVDAQRLVSVVAVVVVALTGGALRPARLVFHTKPVG